MKFKIKPMLSIIIVSFNTRAVLDECLTSLEALKKEINFEVIVVDNASSDGSVELVSTQYPWVRLVVLTKNIGFAAGNNQARKYAKGKIVLFLNPDTIVYKKTLSQCVQYLTLHERVGAMTCKIVLPDGRLDKDARRSFPTPWIALTHFLGFDRVFPESKIFGKYWYGYVDENKFLEVDALQGAFFMARRKVLDKVGWFTEDYFLDGEDIDLSWKIKHLGYKLIYYPSVKIMHIKKVAKKNLDKIARVKYVNNGVNSMETFYRKRMWKEYPLILNLLVVFGIRVIKVIRFMIILIK